LEKVSVAAVCEEFFGGARCYFNEQELERQRTNVVKDVFEARGLDMFEDVGADYEFGWERARSVLRNARIVVLDWEWDSFLELCFATTVVENVAGAEVCGQLEDGVNVLCAGSAVVGAFGVEALLQLFVVGCEEVHFVCSKS